MSIHSLEIIMDSLDDFLKDKELSREGLIKKLASIDYQYDAELNQFV